MKNIALRYLSIPRNIVYLMVVDVFIQLINSAFTLLLNYQMLQHGFKDYEITGMVGNRYLSILLCSLPLALLVKGKRLKPFILTGMVASPLVALSLIWAIHLHNAELIRILMSLWGVSFSLVQVLVMPYILLNGNKEYQTESVALFFAAGNLTLIIAGMFSYALPLLSPFFSVEVLLIMYSTLALAGVYFAIKLPNTEKLGTSIPIANLHRDYDWDLIVKAAVPTFLIAFGAGFTIPFINLFFKHVHGMDAGPFSLMNSAAFTLVVMGGFLVPEIKRRFGYQTAITLVQSVAVLVLFVMGTTEWYSHWQWAVWIAVFTFIIRQPLMNMAGPMTSELTMSYVGEKNREIVSALNAAIWSGCWFASAKIFSVLRQTGLNYSSIIFITVGLYIVGVIWYYRLIKAHERQMFNI